MDQIKTGEFIKELRKESGLTQEQAAEKFNVSRRTVSRWETGMNMPDLDLLIEMSDFYGVDLREILDGERNNGKMDNDMKDTVMKVAEYSNEEKKKMAKVTLVYFIVGLIALIANMIMQVSDLPETFWVGFIKGSTCGFTLVAMVLGILYLTGAINKIWGCRFKSRK